MAQNRSELSIHIVSMAEGGTTTETRLTGPKLDIVRNDEQPFSFEFRLKRFDIIEEKRYRALKNFFVDYLALI